MERASTVIFQGNFQGRATTCNYTETSHVILIIMLTICASFFIVLSDTVRGDICKHDTLRGLSGKNAWFKNHI